MGWRERIFTHKNRVQLERMILLLWLSFVVMAGAVVYTHWPDYWSVYQEIKDAHTDVERESTALVVMEQADLDYLKNSSDTIVETGWCLEGKYVGRDEYVITNVWLAEMQERNRDSIRFNCRGIGVIGDVHSHPQGSHYLSHADAFNWGESNTHLQLRGVLRMPTYAWEEPELYLYEKGTLSDPVKLVVVGSKNNRGDDN